MQKGNIPPELEEYRRKAREHNRELIRDLRSRGLSTAEIAKALDVSEQTVYNYERLKAPPQSEPILPRSQSL